MSSITEYAAPGVRRLAPYVPGKPLETLQREYGISDAIKLASNENPLGASPAAVQATEAAMDSIAVYPDGAGFALRARLAVDLERPADAITLGNGSSDLLDFAVRVFVTPGDEVVYSEHAFALYPLLTRLAGGTGVAVPARDFGHDLEAMAAAVTERTRVVFIANPNNPTGTWVGREALYAFIRGMPEHVLVVVDEAYFEYAGDPGLGADDYPDATRWLDTFPNLLVTRTFSKIHGLAGLRIGYGVSSPEVADLLNRVRPPFNTSTPAQAAALAALDDGEHIRRTLAVNRTGMAQLTAGLAARGLDWIPSVANFVTFDSKRDAAAVHEALLHQGVILRPMAEYGLPRHLRATIGSEAENARVLAALDEALAAVPEGT
ncbi:MAG: histidinol-phosphate transaminase [Pseudomonadota bacterium]